MKRFARSLTTSCLLVLGSAVCPGALAQGTTTQPGRAAPPAPRPQAKPPTALPSAPPAAPPLPQSQPAQPSQAPPSTQPQQAAPSQIAPPPGGDTQTPQAAPRSRHHGMVRLFTEALSEVALRPEQRAPLEDLAREIEARHAPVRAAQADVLRALASQIDAGQITWCQISPRIQAAAATWEATRPGDRTALERVHAMLDPDQRTQLVDALERRIEQHMSEHDTAAYFDKLSNELGLAADQRTRVQTILNAERQKLGADPFVSEHKEGIKRIFEAFRGESFALDELAPLRDATATVTRLADGLVSTVESVLPILTQDQRAKAAQKLRGKADRCAQGADSEGEPEMGE